MWRKFAVASAPAGNVEIDWNHQQQEKSAGRRFTMPTVYGQPTMAIRQFCERRVLALKPRAPAELLIDRSIICNN